MLATIDKHGWQTTSVLAEEGSPPFSYTIGLYHSYGIAELIVFGLKPNTAHGIFSLVAAAAKNGNPLALDEPTNALLESYSCLFVKVPRSEYENYVLSARWYYEGVEFPLYQVVWPSKDGYFPWHEKVEKAFAATQPVLGAQNND